MSLASNNFSNFFLNFCLFRCQEDIAIQEFRKHIGGAVVTYCEEDRSIHVVVSLS